MPGLEPICNELTSIRFLMVLSGNGGVLMEIPHCSWTSLGLNLPFTVSWTSATKRGGKCKIKPVARYWTSSFFATQTGFLTYFVDGWMLCVLQYRPCWFSCSSIISFCHLEKELWGHKSGLDNKNFSYLQQMTRCHLCLQLSNHRRLFCHELFEKLWVLEQLEFVLEEIEKLGSTAWSYLDWLFLLGNWNLV